MKAGIVEHTGKVVCVEDNCLQVSIRQLSSCASCSVRRMCPSSESRDKIISVWEADASGYAVGQEVSVYGTAAMGRKAVGMAFGIPLLLALVWIPVAVLVLRLSDVVSVVSLLVLYGIYFLLLRLWRNRLGQEFRFRIKKR